MYFNKENGRLKAATPEEVAELKRRGKIYECDVCGYKEERVHVEFAEVIQCVKCGKGRMKEVLLW